MKANRANQRLEEITNDTLVVGIDIAKHKHWARFVNYRGVEFGKAVEITNNKSGFNNIITEIHRLCKCKISNNPFSRVIVGMEPTGHYWKALASYLMKQNIKVVGVNPYHTKKAKELDDNSQNKSDKKDALTIAKLVKDGRYFEPYLPEGVYADLRELVVARTSVMKRRNAVKNTITAILDEYFPEYETVFRCPLKGKASIQILKDCPFPTHIIELGLDGVLAVVKKAVKKSVGIKKVTDLMEAAKSSIGVDEGLTGAKIKLGYQIEELELMNRQIDSIESEMSRHLDKTGYADKMLAVKGIGVVTAASLLGEIGDIHRFEDARQIARLAGYNLVEDSSGKNKSGTIISKRGRKILRNVMYLMAQSCVRHNDEFKKLYQYLRTRAVNPLKKKQALIVVAKKIITVLHVTITKEKTYSPDKIFGVARQAMLAA